MKRLLTFAALGALMTFGSASSARANTVTYLFTASSLYSVGFTAGGNCASNLTDCGILGIGLIGITGSGSTITSVSFIAPTLGATDAWSAYSGGSLASPVLAGSGMEEGGTTMAFITQNTHLSTANSYYSDKTASLLPGAAPGTGLSGAAVISGTTTLGFSVTYSTTVATSTPVTLNLELVADELSTVNGTQQGGSKTFSGTANLTGVTGQATPEPSSMILIMAGIAGIAVSRFRRNRA